MKRLRVWICTLALVLSVALPVLAETFSDSDWSTAGNDDVRVIYNMQTVSWPESGLMEAQDRVLLQVQAAAGGMQQGWIRYQVQGAEQVSVRLVSRYGTFFSVMENGLSCGFGAYTTTLNPNATDLQQMRIDPADGTPYANTPFGWQKLTVVLDAFHVLQNAEPPNPARLVDFGLNVYAMSSEADSGTLVTMQRANTSIIFNGYAHVSSSEEFTSISLPADTRYIRIEVNDMQPELQFDKTVRTSVSSVSFTGAKLQMGERTGTGGNGDGDGDGDGDGSGNGNGDGNGGDAGGGNPGGDGGTNGGGTGSGQEVYVYRTINVGSGGQTIIVREVAPQADSPAAAGGQAYPDEIVGMSEGAMRFEDWLITAGETALEDILYVQPPGAGGVSPVAGSAGVRGAADPVVYDLTEADQAESLWRTVSAYAYIGGVSGLMVVYLVRSKRAFK